MKKQTKRMLVGLLAVAALAADTYMTYHLADRTAARTASATVVQSDESQNNPIERFRLERQQLRARQEAQLNEIIYGEQSGEAVVAQAKSQMLDLLDCAEKELTLEGVLQARGFEDALVTVHESSANVLIRRETVTQRESAVILELVMRETGLTGGNIKIIPVK